MDNKTWKWSVRSAYPFGSSISRYASLYHGDLFYETVHSSFRKFAFSEASNFFSHQHIFLVFQFSHSPNISNFPFCFHSLNFSSQNILYFQVFSFSILKIFKLSLTKDIWWLVINQLLFSNRFVFCR